MRPSIKRLHKRVKDHLVPHKGNEHHPHILRHRGLFGVSAILIAVKAFAFLIPLMIPGASYADTLPAEPITKTAIIDGANTARVAVGLPKLIADQRLALAAQTKAEDMAAKGYFSHTSPNGETALDLIRKADYPIHYAAENLAVHFVKADDVQQSWMNSPTHRLNIVDPRYKDIGIGVANGYFERQETTFVVELMGSRIETKTAPIASLSTETMIPGTAYADVSRNSLLSANSLDGLSREFFLYMIALLTGLMLLTFSFRFRRYHVASMSHAMAVVGLAIVLMQV